MAKPSGAFLDLVAGKTPTAVFDTLHACRFLSEAALQCPDAVIGLIRLNLRYRRQPLERAARALLEEGYLNDGGASFYAEPPETPRNLP